MSALNVSDLSRLALSLGLAASCACTCTQEPGPLDEILQAWESDPQRAVALVNQLEELEQAAAVEMVFRTSGLVAVDDGLCDDLALEVTKARCRRFLSRPHLANYGFEGPGASEVELACLAGMGVEPAVGLTVYEQAVAGATVGADLALERGLSVCGCLSVEPLRQECTFRLAEALARSRSSRPDAIAACSQLRQVVFTLCVEHAIGAAGLQVPLHATGGEGWRLVGEFAERIGALPDERSSDGADGLEGFLWSYVMFQSVRGMFDRPEHERSLDRELLERLPPEARPHLRSAVGWAVATSAMDGTEGPGNPGEMLRAVLQGDAPVPVPPNALREFPLTCITDVEPGQAGVEQIHYLTRLSDHRWSSPDPQEDIDLALRASSNCDMPH